jgi:dUTP pyrophosphatase
MPGCTCPDPRPYYAPSSVKVTIYATREDLTPTRGTKHSTGLDMRASEAAIILPGRPRRVPTGISIHVSAPPGVVTLDIQARGRSGLASNGYMLHVGTVDLDYRGAMDVILFNFTRHEMHISPGDRVGQLIVPEFAFSRFTEKAIPVDIAFGIGVAPVDTERGAGGYGSTGR